MRLLLGLTALTNSDQDPEIDLKGASVGIIGSGASSIQVVPTIQPLCKNIDVYVRSPTYILPTVGFGIESSNFNAPCMEL